MIKSSYKVKSLYIYPIKSCRGIEVPSFLVGSQGPHYDRRFMLVDERGCFYTQRQNPRLATIHTKLAGKDLEVRAKGMSLLTVNDTQSVGQPFDGMIWQEKVAIIEISESASAWFSEYLNTSLKLVALAPGNGRVKTKDPHKVPFNVNFPDSAPILMTNQQSIDDLAHQAGVSIPINRFRPNILIDGVPSWEEDKWTGVRIGGIEFPVAYKCKRCVVISIDQESAEKGREPLRTLAKFRHGLDLTFGLRLIHRGTGVIKVGDPVIPLKA